MKRLTFSFLVGTLLLSFFASLVPSSTAEAAFPGYNGKLLFWTNKDGNSEIYSLDAQGVTTNLTNNPANDYYPAWSPDGTKIVFSSERDGDRELYVMNSDGSNQTRLTYSPGQDMLASWSPDGTKIIFRSARDGNQEIYVMNSDGSNQVNITNNAASDAYVEWSITGKISFTSNRAAGVWRIYTMNPDGSNVALQGTGNRMSTWSPDGSKIAYLNSSSGTDGIFISNADGSNAVSYTNDSYTRTYPSWSPDGNRVAFSSLVDGIYALQVLNVNSGSIETIPVFEGANINNISWQPLPNRPPVLGAKTLTTQSGLPQVVDVLEGATDEEALPISNLTITRQPSHGTATIDELGRVHYTAPEQYVGTSDLEYRVCDTFMLDQKCSTATLPITVTPTLELTVVGANTTDGSSDVIAATNRPTFSGRTTPFAEVRLEIHSDPMIFTTLADMFGFWSITPPQAIPPGSHMVYIFSTLNGQTTQLTSFGLTIQLPGVPNTGVASEETTGIWLQLFAVISILSVVGVRYMYVLRKTSRILSP